MYNRWGMGVLVGGMGVECMWGGCGRYVGCGVWVWGSGGPGKDQEQLVR